jgi:non-heme chloroperoxidase
MPILRTQSTGRLPRSAVRQPIIMGALAILAAPVMALRDDAGRHGWIAATQPEAGVSSVRALIGGAGLRLNPSLPGARLHSSSPLDRIQRTDADGVRRARVQLGNGLMLDVAESGAADGEPVLFLHGFTDSWFSFSTVLERLPAEIRAIAPSMRGHGDSERPSCCYRVADFSTDVIELLDALQLERVTLVGHSMGSFIAQRVAIDHPDRIARLVLIGSGTTARFEAAVEFNAVVQTLTDPIAAEFVREFQESTVFQPLPVSFMETVIDESRKLPAHVWRDALAGLLSDAAEDELHRIDAPTLIVWGDRDMLWTRPQQEGLQRSIRGSRLLVYSETGHATHWERPDRIARDLQEFIRAN